MDVYNPKSEYDAFGPWIYELNDINQLPPLFSSRYRESNHSLMLIEIPRNIERRNAVQGMDLYDYVMGMYEDYLYLLERKENSVLELKIPYDEIDMIEDFRDLLLGRLTIFTTGRKIEILYNTAGADMIFKAVSIIRGKYAKKSYIVANMGFGQNPQTEIRYSNLLVSMQHNGDEFDASVAQPPIALKAAHQNLFLHLLHAIIKKEMLPSLHLSNSREILIISRGKSFKHVDAVFSCALNYIPIQKIQDIKFIHDDTYSNLLRLNIVLKSYTQMYNVSSSNKSAQEYYTNLKNLL